MVTIRTLSISFRGFYQPFFINESIYECNLFRSRNGNTLSGLYHLNKFCRLQQTQHCSGIQPGKTTSNYHMPVVRAWQGLPSVINPMIAGAAKKKTDKLDAERLSFHDLTEVWEASYVPSDDIQELRVLIAERDHFTKLATQCSNRINNIIVRFGLTVGRGSSVTKNPDVRALLEDLISDSPSAHDNICPLPLPPDIKHLIRLEYRYYDEFTSQADYFLQLIRQKVLSLEWETKDGTLSGEEMVRILCTTPGVGEITCFTWLAYIGTPNRFRIAKALAAYAGLDPSLKVSAGKVISMKKRAAVKSFTKFCSPVLIVSCVIIQKLSDVGAIRWLYLPANGRRVPMPSAVKCVPLCIT